MKDIKEKMNLVDRVIFVIISVFIFLLPIKFGAPVGVPEINIFPISINDWIFSIWSPSIFSVIVASILLIRCIFIKGSKELFKGVNLSYLAIFVCFAVFSIFGYINATCLDFAVTQIGYYFGLLVALFLFERYLLDLNDVKIILWVIAISTIVISLYGIFQYYSGLSETRDYIQSISAMGDKRIPKDFLIRIGENLVFSTFAISNSFAAHLILTLPICIYLFLWKNPFQHKFFRQIISLLLILIVFVALYLSGSRGAILSLLIAAFFMFLILVLRGKRLFYLILGIPGIFLIFSIPKNSASILIRFDYLHAGLSLLKNNLFFGSGWGEFFQSYTYLKTFPSFETPHDPHNFFVNIGSQAGLLELICGILIFAYPLVVGLLSLYRLDPKKRVSDINLYLLVGVIAWEIHSMIDINAQIPGTFAVFIIFSIILIMNGKGIALGKINMLTTRKIIPIIICFLTLLVMVPRVIGEYYAQIEHQLSLSQSSIFYNQKIFDGNKNIKFYFKKAGIYMPYSPFIYADMAQFYFDRKEYKNSEEYLECAIVRARKRANFYYNLAIVQFDMGEVNKAVESLNEAYKLYPYKYKKDINDMKSEGK